MLAVAVPLAQVAYAQWRKNAIVKRLDSADLLQRQWALNAVVREAGTDSRLFIHVVGRLPGLPGDAAIQTANALDRAGRGEDERMHEGLVRSAADADNADFDGIFAWLAARQSSHVEQMVNSGLKRYAIADAARRDELFALIDGAGYWSTPQVPFDIWLGHLLQQVETPDLLVRLNLLRQLAEIPAQQADFVPQSLAQVLSRLGDDPEPAVRFRTAYLLANLLPLAPEYLDGLHRLADDSDARVSGLAQRLVEAWSAYKQPRERPADTSSPAAGLTQLLPIPPDADEAYWKQLLQQLEATPTGSMDLPDFDPSVPYRLRPEMIRVALAPRPDLLRDLFTQPDAALRDWASVVAVMRFDTATLEALIRELVQDYDPEARISASVLAGLSGVHTDWLNRLRQRDSRFAVQRMAQVGLWMQQGDPVAMAKITSLLGRSGLPQSTLWLALLQGGSTEKVFEDLFGADGLSNKELAELLGRQRWGRVLERYLPPTAPPLDWWADRSTFAEQLEAMRAWWAVHRYAKRPAAR